MISQNVALGALFGMMLMGLDVWVLWSLARRFTERPGSGTLVSVLLSLKFATFFGLAWLALRYLPIDPLSFGFGVVATVGGIALYYSWWAKRPEAV